MLFHGAMGLFYEGKGVGFVEVRVGRSATYLFTSIETRMTAVTSITVSGHFTEEEPGANLVKIKAWILFLQPEEEVITPALSFMVWGSSAPLSIF